MTTTTHPDLPFGRVIGRFLYAMPDTEDLDRMPDAFPAVGSITITSMQEVIKAELPVPTTVIRTVYTYDLDAEGYLVDKQGNRGVWLIEGAYKVSYNILGATIKSHDILVLSGNDADHPIDLLYAQPPGGPVLTASQYAELNSRLSALEMTSVGLHASSHAAGGSDPVTPSSIGAGSIGSRIFASDYTYQVTREIMQSPKVLQDTDLDTVVDGGYYYTYSNITNTPPTHRHNGWLEVVRYTNETFVLQRWTSFFGTPGDTMEVWVRTRAGSVWGPWSQMGPAVGLGSPVGRYPATVGAKWRDRESRLGVAEWIAGTNGWEVSNGDTGWRNMTSNAVWTEGILSPTWWVRRICNRVDVSFEFTTSQAVDRVTEGRLSALVPSGFTYGGTSSVMRVLIGDGGKTNNVLFLNSSGADGSSLRLDTNPPAVNVKWRGTASWITNDPWPNSLPGIPA